MSRAGRRVVDMPEPEGITAEDLRARADHLREVLRALDDGELQASGRERAFIAGALRATELMQPNDFPGRRQLVTPDTENQSPG